MANKRLADKLADIERDDKNRRKIEEADLRRKIIDQKYDSITTYVVRQLNKREVKISDDNFDNKLDELLDAVLNSKLYEKRFHFENRQDIVNAIKRKLNAELNKEKQGYSRYE